MSTVLEDAKAFANWWQRRHLPNDRALVAAAARRGLLYRTRGLIVLTEAGRKLRAQGELNEQQNRVDQR